jgi:hypothetical protein
MRLALPGFEMQMRYAICCSARSDLLAGFDSQPSLATVMSLSSLMCANASPWNEPCGLCRTIVPLPAA